MATRNSKKGGDIFENLINDISLIDWKKFTSLDDEVQLEEIPQSSEDESEEEIQRLSEKKVFTQGDYRQPAFFLIFFFSICCFCCFSSFVNLSLSVNLI